jgi:drug/metabolite transporter (DMT)-like permease
MPLVTYILLAIAIFAQAAGNVFLSKGMKQLASGSLIIDGNFPALFSQVVNSPSIWAGTCLLIIFFLLFLTVLSRAELSFVLPVISIEIVVNVAFAGYFLNEPVSLIRWIGAVLISAGVILVMRSGQQAASAECDAKTPGVQGG